MKRSAYACVIADVHEGKFLGHVGKPEFTSPHKETSQKEAQQILQSSKLKKGEKDGKN